jgi:hypothetical protein
MGLLRLLTIEAVLGQDVPSSRDAWGVYLSAREDLSSGRCRNLEAWPPFTVISAITGNW